MTTPEPPISPRGVPQLRTDWLADVARRLALLGIDRLRELRDDADGHLTDQVDGRTWTFKLMKFSDPSDTDIEFDAELWAPDDDRERPTLRAGFELSPRWDDRLGPVTLVRTEIGPRGAVTFDPENWMVTVPTDPSVAATPTPSGVNPGEWRFDGGLPDAPKRSVVASDDARLRDVLPGKRISLDALQDVVDGEQRPELRFSVYAEPPPATGFFGRFRTPKRDAPVLAALVTADGPISASWTGTGTLQEAIDDWLLLGDKPPVLSDGQVSFRGDAGVLTLTGPALRLDLR
jgi:hypothetical protein